MGKYGVAFFLLLPRVCSCLLYNWCTVEKNRLLVISYICPLSFEPLQFKGIKLQFLNNHLTFFKNYFKIRSEDI